MNPQERILRIQLIQKLNQNPSFTKELGVKAKLEKNNRFISKKKEDTKYVKEFK